MATGTYTYDAANKILDQLLRGKDASAPDRVMIGLFTDDPGAEADLSVELEDSNYERKDAAGSGDPVEDGFDEPSEGETKNSKSIEFNPINDEEVEVTHFGIFGRYGDDKDADELIYAAPLYSSRTLQVGDVLTWDAGSIVVNKIETS